MTEAGGTAMSSCIKAGIAAGYSTTAIIKETMAKENVNREIVFTKLKVCGTIFLKKNFEENRP